MLKYLWMVVQDLFVTVTFAAWMRAYFERLLGKRGRSIHRAAVLLGVAAALALAIVKGTTNKIISSHWNHYIYAVLILFTVCFAALSLILGRRENEGSGAKATAICCAGSGLSAVMIFYSLPGVLLYPFNFNTMGNGYLSSYYMVRLAGWALALILLLVYARVFYHCALKIKAFHVSLVFLNAAVITNALYCFGRFFVPWVNRAKWLNWPVRYTDDAYGWIGNWMMFTADHSMLFIWAVLALAALLCIVVFIENTHIDGAYENAAQKRKLRARCRSLRRTAACTFVAAIAFTLVLTLIKGYDTRVIELSAPETYSVEGDTILIPMESVNDGHLHRFEYKTQNDVNIRWIVVRKPNAASFGVGFDACEVCGNAGYFERNGQVVCKRCDVVMNINTIGFKGGCNPIPLAYAVEGGNLVFQMDDILAGEREFK